MIPEEQRNTLVFNLDCGVCEWLEEWSKRERADIGMLMQPYIPHRLQHSIDELTKRLEYSLDIERERVRKYPS